MPVVVAAVLLLGATGLVPSTATGASATPPGLRAAPPAQPIARAIGAPADQAWVQAAYADFLGRAPSDVELDAAAARLESGTPRSTLAAGLASSDEWVGRILTGFYRDTLGRAPDAGGLAFWVGRIRSGRSSVAAVAVQFYASPEYYGGIGGGTDSSWVTDLYRKVLHRDPDPAGLRYWVGRTASAGRGYVAAAFYGSLESRRDRVDALYMALLGRPADNAGLSYWAGRLAGEGDLTLAVQLAASAEFDHRAQSRFPVGSATPLALAWTVQRPWANVPAPGPAPTIGMNLVDHDQQLYLGTSTIREGAGRTGPAALVYRKASPQAPWSLDARFEGGSERVGAMDEIHVANGPDGRPIAGGPIDLVVAGTNQEPSSGAQPVRARIRNDSSGRWTSVAVSDTTAPVSQVREVVGHRDRVTGADLVFLAASPGPFGIYRGSYDPTAPGKLRWEKAPEITALSTQNRKEKWFGMAEANGVLFASNNTGIYRRVDGVHPTWVMVADASSFPTSGRDTNPEFRGLTAVPTVPGTGWSEPEMLIFSRHNAMWRMRAGGGFEVASELDLRAAIEQRFGTSPGLVEAAYNRLNPVTTADGHQVWPIGFEVTPSIDDRAFYFLRTETGAYTLAELPRPGSPGFPGTAPLVLARDIVPSPFPSDNAVYATGFNVGAPGAAWVARGTRQP